MYLGNNKIFLTLTERHNFTVVVNTVVPIATNYSSEAHDDINALVGFMHTLTEKLDFRFSPQETDLDVKYD